MEAWGEWMIKSLSQIELNTGCVETIGFESRMDWIYVWKKCDINIQTGLVGHFIRQSSWSLQQKVCLSSDLEGRV